MKQKDIALIIIIAAMAGVLSFFISHKLFASPHNRMQKAEVVDAITADFPLPSTKYYNDTSVNPAQEIQIGNNNNANPFSGGQQ